MTGPGCMVSLVRIVPVSSKKLRRRGTYPYLPPQKNTNMVIISKLIGGVGWDTHCSCPTSVFIIDDREKWEIDLDSMAVEFDDWWQIGT